MWRITAFDRSGARVCTVEVDSGEVTVGREADRRIVLPSPAVSRRHARLVLDGPLPHILDEGSANGVIVNGLRIERPTAVVPGSRVDIAEYHLAFERDGDTGARRRRDTGGGPLRLVGEGGPLDGRDVPVERDELVLGRAVDNDLVVDEPSLSRRHAKLRRLGPRRIEIEDLASANGTFVNGERVTRAEVGPGDALRFGEVRFRVDGGPEDPQIARTDEAGQRNSPRRASPLLVAAMTGLVLVGVGAAFMVMRRSPAPAPASTSRSLAQIEQQVEADLRDGRQKLEAHDFDAARALLDRVLELEPGNAEARRLLARALVEPQNDKLARQIAAKIGMSGDRAALEEADHLLVEISAESAFRAVAAGKLAARLESFGVEQCKARRYADCAWALCRSRILIPDGVRPAATSVDALRDAERRLVGTPGFAPCPGR